MRNYGGNDDSNSIARAGVEMLAAIRKQLADDAAALRASTGFFDATSIAGASVVTIEIPVGVDLFEVFIWNVTMLTDGSALHLRTVSGATVFSGASDYAWANLKGATHTNDSADSQVVLGSGLDLTLSSNLHLRVNRPRLVNSRKIINWSGLMIDSAASAPMTWSGGARCEGAAQLAAEITAIQLLPSAGTFTIGYGVKYSSFGA